MQRCDAMRTEDLRAFFSIVDGGSLTSAATALGVPKSTIGRRLARLEEELGAELVLRTSRSVQITETGRMLHRQGLPALAHLDEVKRAVVDQSEQPRGPLRVSAAADIASTYLGPMAGAFIARYPEVQLSLTVSDTLVDLVRDGIDVALRLHMNPLPSSTSLRARRLCRVETGLFAAPSYLEVHGRPPTPAGLEGHRCLSMSASPRRWVLHHARSKKSVTPRIEPALISNDQLLLRDAACEGAGIAEMPSFISAEAVRAGRLQRVLPGWSTFVATLSALWPATQYTSPRVRAFVDAAVGYFNPPPWERVEG